MYERICVGEGLTMSSTTSGLLELSYSQIQIGLDLNLYHTGGHNLYTLLGRDEDQDHTSEHNLYTLLGLDLHLDLSSKLNLYTWLGLDLHLDHTSD